MWYCQVDLSGQSKECKDALKKAFNSKDIYFFEFGGTEEHQVAVEVPSERMTDFGKWTAEFLVTPRWSPKDSHISLPSGNIVRFSVFLNKPTNGELAQLVEPAAHNRLVAGSSPALPTTSSTNDLSLLEHLDRLKDAVLHGEERAVIGGLFQELRTAILSIQGASEKGWEIDHSTPSPILTYEKCSVIQDAQAYYVMRLLKSQRKTLEVTPEMADAARYLIQWLAMKNPTESALISHCKSLGITPPEGCRDVAHVPTKAKIASWIFQAMYEASPLMEIRNKS